MVWSRVKVEDLGRVVTGKTPKTAEKDNYGGNIMFVTPSDDMDAKYIYSTGKTITEKGRDSVKGAIIPAGTICVSCIGSDLGKVVITTEECVTNQQINSIIVDTANYDIDFVYYSMLILGKELNFHSKTSTAVPIVNKSRFSSYEISCPTIAEQKRIAGILTAIDSKIEKNGKINDNLYEQLTSYYKQLFAGITSTTSVGEIADNIFSGGTPSTANEAYWNGEHYWLSSGETSNRFIVSTIKTITDEGITNSSTRKADKYDIAIASAGQGHTRGQTSMLLTETYVNQSIIVVHANGDYLPFLFWNIANRYEELRVISNSNSIRGSLTTKMISSLSIPKADTEQIKQFSNLAWPIIKKIEINLNENGRLSTMRDALLPKLMCGELDVSNLDI